MQTAYTPSLTGERDEKDIKEFALEHVEDVKKAPEDQADMLDQPPVYLEWSVSKTLRVFWKPTMFALFAAAGGTVDFYSIISSGQIIVLPGFIEKFGTVYEHGQKAMDAQVISNWGAIQSAAQITGLVGAPVLCDKFGRKFNIWCMAVFLVISYIVEIFAPNWQIYSIAKYFSWTAVGLGQSGLATYIAEIAPTRIRGLCLAAYSLWGAVGQLLGAVTLNLVAQTRPMDYKIVFYTEFVFVALLIPSLVFAPESPYFHVRMGNEAKARKSLKTLYGGITEYNLDVEYARIARTVEAEQKLNTDSWRKQYTDCFKGRNLMRVFVGFAGLFASQISGIPVFFGLSSFFFSIAGYDKPFQATVIQGCILIMFFFGSQFLLERFGRRSIILSGNVVLAFINLAVGALYYKTPLVGWALVTLTCLWTATYACTVGPVANIMVAEIPTQRLRAKSIGMAQLGAALVSLIWSYTVPLMLSPQKAGWSIRTCFLWAGLALPYTAVLYFVFPETKGRSFAELDELFEEKVPLRKFKGHVTSTQKAIAENGRNGEA